jgi:hypothetical protein
MRAVDTKVRKSGKQSVFLRVTESNEKRSRGVWGVVWSWHASARLLWNGEKRRYRLIEMECPKFTSLGLLAFPALLFLSNDLF